MSIVPASRLSASDLSRLGNNLSPGRRPRPSVDRRASRVVGALNRSLACVGESIDRLSAPRSAVAR